MSATKLVVTGLCLSLLLPQTVCARGTTALFDFDEQLWMSSQWRVSVEGKKEALLKPRPFPGRGGRVMTVQADFPGAVTARVRDTFDWPQADRLSFEVYVPADAPEGVQLVVYVKDSELRWYQTLVKAWAFEPGKWSHVGIDISDHSRSWECRGHSRPWNGYVRRGLRELGLRFFSRQAYRGPIHFDNVAVHTRPENTDAARRGIVGFRTNRDVVGRYETFEITFDLTQTYSNPFDPRVIDVTARFVAPSGKVTVVPAFFYQGYRRAKSEGQERLTAVGRPEWKVRFTSREVGEYSYSLRACDEAGPLATGERSFRCCRSDRPGFVRISAQDSNCLELDNGTFFYPIGLNVAADFDERNAAQLGVLVSRDEGTYAYDRFFRNMAENGVTLARVWMTSWWLGLEWTKRYAPHYHDLGRYSMDNAWRLDYLVELAERLGIKLMLVLTPHGHLTERFESNWPDSPYNYVNGGPLRRPRWFFIHPEARRCYEQRVRYILARWGYSTAICGWEIFNEIDLAEYYRSQASRINQWIGRTARYIRQHDQGRHLVTSSLVHWQRGDELWRSPEMDYTTAHIFGVDLPAKLRSAHELMSQLGKPFFVTETGLHWQDSPPEATEVYVHVGLWSSYMMPFPGTAMPWWWVYIDQRGLYSHFRALAKFAEGEDRRGQRLRPGQGRVVDRNRQTEASELGIEYLVGRDTAAFWVYDRSLLVHQTFSKRSIPASFCAEVKGLPAGSYRVELWDTYEGRRLSQVETETETDGSLLVPLPEFQNDIAAKVKIDRGEREDGKIIKGKMIRTKKRTRQNHGEGGREVSWPGRSRSRQDFGRSVGSASSPLRNRQSPIASLPYATTPTLPSANPPLDDSVLLFCLSA